MTIRMPDGTLEEWKRIIQELIDLYGAGSTMCAQPDVEFDVSLYLNPEKS